MSVKFLGIYLDDRLNFNDHVSYLLKKLSKTVGIMYKMSCFLPPHILRMLYFSLFYSQLNYCINVWGGRGITNSNYNSVYQYFTLCKLKKKSLAITNTFLIGSQSNYHSISMAQDSYLKIK